MSSNFMCEFKKECKKNREYLGYSFHDVSVSLIDVSEEEYKSFEEGNMVLSKENIERLANIFYKREQVFFIGRGPDS